MQLVIPNSVRVSRDNFLQDMRVTCDLAIDRTKILDACQDEWSVLMLQDIVETVVDAVKVARQIDDVGIVGSDSMPMKERGVPAIHRQAVPLLLR